jgi:phage baseplate assembly protein W
MARADRYTPITQKTEYYSDFLINLDQNPVTGNLARVTNEDSVKQSIKSLLLTNRSERLFQPLAGSRIKSLLFENFDSFLISNIESEIKETIQLFEPRAEIKRVEINESRLDTNTLEITITFSVINSPEIFNMFFLLNRVR